MRLYPVIFCLISLLPVVDQENHHLAGSDVPINASVGADVVLPCHVEPPVYVRNTSVKWMFNSSDTVHLFRSGDDDPKNQGKRYKGRTYLNHTMLEHGDISLKLANVTKDDEGNYTCEVLQLYDTSQKPEERNVNLVVVDGKEDPDRTSGETDDDDVGGGAISCGAISCGVMAAIVVGVLLLLAFIRCRVVRCRRGKPRCSGFPCRSNNSRHEQGRNDREQSGNGDPGDEPEEMPLQDVGQPNQRVDESSPLS